MVRLLTNTLFALSFSMFAVACGSSEKATTNNNAPTVEMRPDGEAIIGTWSDGTTTLTLGADKKYSWEMMRPCGAPPCPTTTSGGTWVLRSGKLYLDPNEGSDEVIKYNLDQTTRSLGISSSSKGKSWTLTGR